MNQQVIKWIIIAVVALIIIALVLHLVVPKTAPSNQTPPPGGSGSGSGGGSGSGTGTSGSPINRDYDFTKWPKGATVYASKDTDYACPNCWFDNAGTFSTGDKMGAFESFAGTTMGLRVKGTIADSIYFIDVKDQPYILSYK